MSTYYKKHNPQKLRRIVRFFGLGMGVSGVVILLYLSFPIISWKLYFEPAFASQNVTSPIPKPVMIAEGGLQSLIKASEETLRGVDYTDASNWYPVGGKTNANSPSYLLTIPKLNIKNAVVSTSDTNLKQHLVQYGGTPLPPQKGTTVIFGHSTLPQLYNPDDYTTIFANILRVKIGDPMQVSLQNVIYTYKVVSIRVVNPDDISVLAQDYSNSFLTIITCTPPGTIWKRLIVKAELQNL